MAERFLEAAADVFCEESLDSVFGKKGFVHILDKSETMNLVFG